MPMVRTMRMLNAIEAGTLSGAQFEDMLSNPGRLGEWNVLLGMRGQARRIVASSTAMTAILESPTATTYLFANPVSKAAAESSVSLLGTAIKSADLTAVFSSSTAAKGVVSSSTAMSAAAASSAAKLALYESDIALTECFNSPTAMNALRAAAQIYYRGGSNTTAASLTTTTYPTVLSDSGKYLLLGVSGFANATRYITVSTRRNGSTRPAGANTLGFTSADPTATTAGALACCPITGPLSFVGNGPGTAYTYLSLLRCDV